MGQPIAIADGIAMAMPDICLTPAPPAPPIPIPYPNIAQLADATKTSTSGGNPVKAGGKAILLEDSEIAQSSGNEAGANGGVTSGVTKGACAFTSFSATVKIHGKKVVRMGDTTSQNKQNAVGVVLGGLPTVMVGG